MAGKSLPPVSAKVVADAEQFIAEFRRAERAAQGTTGRIGNEVDKMAKSLSKRFSLGDVGKSLLQGFGLGSGFAVVNTAFSKITASIEQHQLEIKKIEDTWTRIVAKSTAYQRSLLSPKDNVGAMEQDMAGLQKQYLELVKMKDFNFTSFNPSTGQGTTVTLTRPDDSNETVQAILDNLEAQHDLSVKISEATAQMTKETKKGEAALAADWASQAIARRKQLQATIEEGNKAFMKEQELAREHAAAMEKVADAYKDLMDPSREWLRRMAEVDAAHAAGKLSAEEHADSLALLQSQMAEANAVKDFGWFEDDAKKAATGAESAILNFTDSINSAFEESIIQGKELSDVLGDLGRSVMATFLKLSVVNPLMNSLFGGVNGWDMLPSFGGGKAAGGPVSAGTAYMVGERGPELFMPDTAGTIVPNRALGGAAASVVKNFFIDARGADRTGLAQLYSYIRSIDGSIEERAVSAVIDQRRRGAFGY